MDLQIISGRIYGDRYEISLPEEIAVQIPVQKFQVCMLIIGLFLIVPSAYSEQTRKQCDKCCKSTNQDEYYQEQCLLKCFRNHDHCRGGASTHTPQQPQQSIERQTPPNEVQSPPVQPPQRQVQPKRVPPPPVTVDQQPVAPPEQPRQAQTRPAFQWPNPLNLVPGREWEAAGQILAVNNFPPQHPNYQPALKAIEGVLINFARANPTGGKLPTTQLEQILRQYR